MQLSSKSWQGLILSVAGVCSISLPFVQTAQAQEVHNLCGKESTFVSAETKHFLVSICGGDEAHTYVGLNKNTGKAIRLPLTINGTYNKGSFFEAANGYYNYQLTVVGNKKNLTVRDGIRVILREPILRMVNGADPGA